MQAFRKKVRKTDTDGRTDGLTDGQTDRVQTYSPLRLRL